MRRADDEILILLSAEQSDALRALEARGGRTTRWLRHVWRAVTLFATRIAWSRFAKDGQSPPLKNQT